MACNCGAKKNTVTKTFVHTKPDGSKDTYRTEVEAAAAVNRVGGSYRAQ